MAESVSALSNSLTELIAINESRYGHCPRQIKLLLMKLLSLTLCLALICIVSFQERRINW